MMKVGVVSDTHTSSLDRIEENIVNNLKDIDLIIHAGDFTSIEVLEGLKSLGKIKAVYGNMDPPSVRDELPAKETIMLKGKKIGIMHGWGPPTGLEEKIRKKFEDVDAIVYGHTHQAKNEVIAGVLFFNSGKASDSFGILEVGEEIEGEIIKH